MADRGPTLNEDEAGTAAEARKSDKGCERADKERSPLSLLDGRQDVKSSNTADAMSQAQLDEHNDHHAAGRPVPRGHIMTMNSDTLRRAVEEGQEREEDDGDDGQGLGDDEEEDEEEESKVPGATMLEHHHQNMDVGS